MDVVARVNALVIEYSQDSLKEPLDPKASLRGDLGVESLSLVSIAVALGDDHGIDLIEWGTDLGKLETLADLIALGQELARQSKLSAASAV